MLRCGSLRAATLRLASLPICLCVVVSMLTLSHVSPLQAANIPARPFWTTRSSLESPEGIRRVIAAAVAGGFDTVMIPITLEYDPRQGFDGAREIVKDARERGIRVHAWIDVTLAASAGELPAARDHVIYQHPEWLMVSRELAPEVLKVDVRSPAYLGRLSRWARANSPRIEGLYISPLSVEAANYLVTAVTAAARRYEVDGVFLDTVRFPGADFDYSRHAMDVFRADTRSRLTTDQRARLDEIEAIDPYAYAEEFPDQWRQFRQSRLTSLMSRLRKALAGVSPALAVNAGVASDAGAALADSFQDWSGWMQTGLVDGVGRRSAGGGAIVFTTDSQSPGPAVAR
jgi:uncharacterized lipoprotein YddW (UPF0748 family)